MRHIRDGFAPCHWDALIPVRRLREAWRCGMRWLTGVTFWLPFFFAALLSGITLWSKGAGWPAFYSFLPMAFFFTSSAFMELVRRIRKLEERVKSLEGNA